MYTRTKCLSSAATVKDFSFIKGIDVLEMIPRATRKRRSNWCALLPSTHLGVKMQNSFVNYETFRRRVGSSR